MNISISEFFKRVSEEKSLDTRVFLLKSHESWAIKRILELMFNKTVTWNLTQGQLTTSTKWLLPEGMPPFKVNEYDNQHGNLLREMRRLYIFLEGGNTNINKMKRETLFIGLLETIDKNDAEFICNLKDGKYPKNITVNLVNRAFPGLIQVEEKNA